MIQTLDKQVDKDFHFVDMAGKKIKIPFEIVLHTFFVLRISIPSLFRFPSLFGDVESEIQESGDLGIDAYGTSMPTLEEVFLRLGEEADAESVSTQCIGLILFLVEHSNCSMHLRFLEILTKGYLIFQIFNKLC